MKEFLYCNLTRGTVSGSPTSQGYAFRPAVAGEVRLFALRFVEEAEGRTLETNPSILSIQLSVSKIDARPLGGKIAYQFGEGGSTPQNTTAELPWNHNAAALKAALPTEVIQSYGVPVAEDVPGGVVLRFPQDVLIRPRNNSLWPLSFLRSNAWPLPEGGWVHDLRMVQAPLTQTTSFIRILPPAPHVEKIRAGGEVPGYTWSDIQELTVPAAFRGTFHLVNPGSLASSTVLSRDDNARTIQEALAKIFPDGTVKVTNPTDQVARIEFLGAYMGLSMPEIGVVVDSSPPGDPTLTLDFRHASIYAALRETDAYDAWIEARALVARNGVPEGEPMVLFRAPISVLRDQNWDGMSTQAMPVWLRPPNPVSYVPYDDSQVYIGTHRYRRVIGDGVATSITVDHNLDAEDITAITVKENDSSGKFVANWEAESNGRNSIIFKFQEPPAPDSLIVNITAGGEVSAFSPHEHTMGQVTGLAPMLEDIYTRLTRVESLLGRQDVVVVVSGNKKTEFKFPTVGELLPDISLVDVGSTIAAQVAVDNNSKGVVIGGTEIDKNQPKDDGKKAADALPPNVIFRSLITGIGREEQAGAAARKDAVGNIIEPEIPKLSADPALWPARRGTKYPLLLQAITEAAPADVSAIPQDRAEGVYRYTGAGELILPAGSGRRMQRVPHDGHFAIRQGAVYRVTTEGSDVYYPLEFNRTLWRVFVESDHMQPGARLSVSGELRMRLVGDFFDAVTARYAPVDYAARLWLICEAIEVSDDATLGAPEAVTQLGRTTIALSPSLETMRWSLSIENIAGAISSNWTAYGKGTEAGGFGVPAALRLRLGGFDVDDARAAATVPVRGQIALIMPQTKLEITI